MFLLFSSLFSALLCLAFTSSSTCAFFRRSSLPFNLFFQGLVCDEYVVENGTVTYTTTGIFGEKEQGSVSQIQCNVGYGLAKETEVRCDNGKVKI